MSDAISTAYRRAGFVDGEPTTDLVAPRLADVHERLRARRDGEAVATRLER